MPVINPLDRILNGGGICQVNADGSISLTPVAGMNVVANSYVRFGTGASLAAALLYNDSTTDAAILQDTVGPDQDYTPRYGLELYQRHTSATTTQADLYGIFANVTSEGAGDFPGDGLTAVTTFALAAGAGHLAYCIGHFDEAEVDAGLVDECIATKCQAVVAGGTSTILTAAQLQLVCLSGAVTNAFGARILTPRSGAAVTNNYGLYIQDQSGLGSTVHRNLHSAGANSDNRLDGSLSLGKNLSLDDASNLIAGTSTGTKIGTGTTQKLGWWNATPVVQNTGWSTANSTSKKSLDVNTATLGDLANFVATRAISDLAYGLLGV